MLWVGHLSGCRSTEGSAVLPVFSPWPRFGMWPHKEIPALGYSFKASSKHKEKDKSLKGGFCFLQFSISPFFQFSEPCFAQEKKSLRMQQI